MSIIIDLLKRKNHTSSSGEGSKNSVYDSETQEVLAETYLNSPPKRTKPLRDAPPKTETKNRIIPVSLIALLFLFCGILIYIFSTHALNVDITVNKGVSPPYENLLVTQRPDLIGGAAAAKGGDVSLTDAGAKRPPGIAINLIEDLDLSKKSILIRALPKKGGGDLRLILRDKNYRSYISDTLRVLPDAGGRQNFIISADRPKQSIDIRSIRHIRLELEGGMDRTGNNSVILIEKVLLINDRQSEMRP